MHHIRRGRGRPLLLVHGLGGDVHSFDTVIDALAAEREVIAVDLPGFGQTPPLAGEVSMATLGDALTAFLQRHGLIGVDAVGTSMGARLVLELVRRGGVLGAVVSLDPGGFWRGWERHAFYGSVRASIALLRALRPWLRRLAAHPVSRTSLLLQFSAKPWLLPAAPVANELCSYVAAPSFNALLHSLAYGPTQAGATAGSITPPLVIGWGRHDRVCFTAQAARAQALFPDARLHWFEHSGHFPHWDEPAATARLILEATARPGAERIYPGAQG
ncbi:alpha/beta fold hydrolase [Lysobacter korlensis]|uniref:Alpha/beta fold hydrolase n=1 Tax=Lysobacter korlensis TaxID=553636 RepID=A0ABV6RSI0_9GAMM